MRGHREDETRQQRGAVGRRREDLEEKVQQGTTFEDSLDEIFGVHSHITRVRTRTGGEDDIHDLVGRRMDADDLARRKGHAREGGSDSSSTGDGRQNPEEDETHTQPSCREARGREEDKDSNEQQHNINIIFVQYMHNICTHYLYNICKIFAQYFYNICAIIVQYLQNICTIFAQYLHTIRTIFV